MIELKPYNGNEPFIFISYAHKNSSLVLPIIARLISDGYRVWFDEGIDPGTEWSKTIARRIQESSCMIAMLSPEYIDSENCKDELDLARQLKLSRITVHILNTELPLDMQMTLNRIQAIHKYKYTDENRFYEKLYEAKFLGLCREGKDKEPVEEELERSFEAKSKARKFESKAEELKYAPRTAEWCSMVEMLEGEYESASEDIRAASKSTGALLSRLKAEIPFVRKADEIDSEIIKLKNQKRDKAWSDSVQKLYIESSPEVRRYMLYVGTLDALYSESGNYKESSSNVQQSEKADKPSKKKKTSIIGKILNCSYLYPVITAMLIPITLSLCSVFDFIALMWAGSLVSVTSLLTVVNIGKLFKLDNRKMGWVFMASEALLLLVAFGVCTIEDDFLYMCSIIVINVIVSVSCLRKAWKINAAMTTVIIVLTVIVFNISSGMHAW